MRIIISYDITSDKMRNKVSKALEEFGVRIQYSVFECSISKKELKILKAKLKELINEKIDSIYFIYLCDACLKKRSTLGEEINIKRINVLTIT